ncbi:MAG: hypothetical protein H6P95_2847, partial [Candidatus Aminicenantes bacterium]|nr:hypothetical protein [Candidatus Aminicenantes bacterium]
DHLAKVLAGKFQRILAASKAKDTSVEAGRAFVEAYVDYTHYLEALHAAIAGSGPDHH